MMKRATAKTLLTAAIAALAALVLPGAPGAAPAPKTLWQGCPTGSGAGQCSIPRGIAADPASGHLYVADAQNRRIVELTAWGEFVKAWGWGVIDGSEELQTCTTVTGCVKGLTGSGTGEFGGFGPQGVALDSAGNVYVADFENDRVEKFDPSAGTSGEEAELLLSFGSPGAGNGQFSWGLALGSFIGIGPADFVYVGDKDRVQKFDSTGNYLGSISLPGERVESLSVDSTGKVYVALFKDSDGGGHSKEEVLKLDPAKPDPFAEPLCAAKVPNPQALATDEDDNLYVVDGRNHLTPQGPVAMQIRKFDSGCKEVQDGQFPFTDGFDASTGIATNTVTTVGGVGLYVSNFFGADYVRAYYPPPDKWPPPLAAPTIDDQFATSADTDSAVVKAKINPKFWADTSYLVEYGTEACSLGGCQSKPLPPGLQLGAGIVNESVTTPGLVLSGLAPATTYHYRFVAQSSGGGPTIGLEETFTTFPTVSLPANPCPNASFREGAGARLPECRAYEMVSPIDKNNGGIEVLERNFATGGFAKRGPARLDQAAPEGEAVTYSATRAFAGAVSAPWSSQYISRRDSLSGWSTNSINAPRGNVALNNETITETPFSAFSEDLCSAWVRQDTDMTLVSGAPVGVPNLYRRRNCGGSDYELLTNVAPIGDRAEDELPFSLYFPTAQGFTADGAHTIMRANTPLTEDASAKEIYQLYETSEGAPSGESADLRLVSVLPNGEAAGVHSSLGTTAGDADEFRSDSVHNALSGDGSRVFWTASTTTDKEASPPPKGSGLQPGNLYLRANPLAPQSESGECDEAGKACTLAIAGPNAEFWTADQSGSLVIYQIGSKLFEAQIEEEGAELTSTSTLIAEGVDGVTGWSEDATRLYFVSSKALAPGAAEGKPNLYFREKGAGFELIGTLAALDELDDLRPVFRISRVSADGLHAVFSSHAALTGFDNTDAVSGEQDAEVFLYDADQGGGGGGELRCVSCNPSEARPAGRLLGIADTNGTDVWAAAQIPRWETQQYASRVLSANGNRLFFESFDALLPSDNNGAKDVYEWQRAHSQAQCEQKGSPLYVKDSGGCLSLISSGESPADSEFIDASSDGRDVFFTTAESLFSEDPGSVDLYDARIGGGFAAKPKVAPCQGEACQSPATAPDDRTPASASFHGASGKPKPRGCPKGKRKVRKAGKARCVKAKQRAQRQSKQKRNHEQRRNNR
jgi:DNA-binding beta-propeller fold protein YncE